MVDQTRVQEDVTQGGLSPQEIKDCTACHTRGYILAMEDMFLVIVGVKAQLEKEGRAPDHQTVLTVLEDDIRGSLASARQRLESLTEEDKDAGVPEDPRPVQAGD